MLLKWRWIVGFLLDDYLRFLVWVLSLAGMTTFVGGCGYGPDGFGRSQTKREGNGGLLAAVPTLAPRFYLRLTFRIYCRAAVPTGKKLWTAAASSRWRLAPTLTCWPLCGLRGNVGTRRSEPFSKEKFLSA